MKKAAFEIQHTWMTVDTLEIYHHYYRHLIVIVVVRVAI